MRIKTSSALRDLDKWKEKFIRRHERLQHALILLLAMLGGSRKGMLLFAIIAPLPVLYSGPGVLLCLIVLCLMRCRLSSYRFANYFLSIFSRLG